ncbi:hypothetical protein MXS87_09855 [Escherichia coli]|nr:hypothetical protein [Escherichia coli]
MYTLAEQQHLTATPELLVRKLAAHFIPAPDPVSNGLNLIFARHCAPGWLTVPLLTFDMLLTFKSSRLSLRGFC